MVDAKESNVGQEWYWLFDVWLYALKRTLHSGKM